MFIDKLENAQILLRKMKLDDFEEIYEVAKNAEIWIYYPDKESYKLENFKIFFNLVLKHNEPYVIIDKITNAIIGSTSYYLSIENSKEVIIGYTFLNQKYWGTGYNKQIKKMMINHAFNSFEIVSFIIAKENFRSLKAIENIGAERIKKFTKNYPNNVKIDCIYLSIKKSNWH